MKPMPSFVVVVALLAAGGCTTSQSRSQSQSSGPSPSSAPAPAAAPAEKGVAASPTPQPTPEPAARRTPALTATQQIEETKKQEKRRDAEILEEQARSRNEELAENEKPRVLQDAKTGRWLERVPKSPSLYVRQGRLYSAVANIPEGFELVREDKDAYYIPGTPPAPPSPATPKKTPTDSAGEEPSLPLILDIPAEEADVVTPPVSSKKLRLEEASGGLPNTGMWRENFELADLDGDKRPEIVTPPPRLSGREIQVFRFDAKTKRWKSAPTTFDDPEKIGFEYGGVTTGDMDGDGRVDIVYGRHGGGPAIAYNLGKLHFRVESKGLIKQMSTRALAIGDLDGDGHPDVVAVSDQPEFMDANMAESQGNTNARKPRADGSIAGFDSRAFLFRDGKYVETSKGLDESCFGYSVGLSAPAADGGEPFFASSCRYQGNIGVLRAFDKKEQAFHAVGEDIVEHYAGHIGTAMGLYQGHPAAFMTYIKNAKSGASRNIAGNGVSVYYRDGAAWHRKRVFKTIEPVVLSQGIAVGDLDGDGLDDIVYADDVRGRLRVFFQRKDGDFDELAPELEPPLVNHTTAVRIADIDGDGRPDIVLMYQYLTGDETKEGGLRAFLNRR